MRFEKGHKAATRRHIVDVASKCVRRDGISAAGIAGIMGEAGLTKGAFSPHFESKD
jgi:AcrR family transcriptional regulator